MDPFILSDCFCTLAHIKLKKASYDLRKSLENVQYAKVCLLTCFSQETQDKETGCPPPPPD